MNEANRRVKRYFHTSFVSIRINFIADGVVGANKAYNEHNNKSYACKLWLRTFEQVFRWNQKKKQFWQLFRESRQISVSKGTTKKKKIFGTGKMPSSDYIGLFYGKFFLSQITFEYLCWMKKKKYRCRIKLKRITL